MTESVSDSLDLRHAATDHATIVTVPARRMIAIDGVGAPSGADHRRAIETLREVADAIRTRVRRDHGVDARIGPVECAWWTHPEPPSGKVAEEFADRSSWHWQLMIEVPDRATDDDVAAAITEAGATGIDHATHVRPISFEEGRSAQVLQVGGITSPSEAVERLYREVEATGGHPHGHLHEIHLSDPRTVGQDRQRVILRLPIESGAR